jgi:hypothetical protein
VNLAWVFAITAIVGYILVAAIRALWEKLK